MLLAALGQWGYAGGRLNGVVPEGSQDLASLMFTDMAALRNGELFRYADLRRQEVAPLQCIAGETVVFLTLPSLRAMLETPPGLDGLRRINVKHILTLVAPSELACGLHMSTTARLEGMNLIPVYGSVEMGFVGGATPHTFRDAFVELMQPGLFHVSGEDGTLSDTGVGKLVYTSLGREAFPFVKYEIGNVVTIKDTDTPTPNGRCSRLIRFERRSDPLILKVPNAAGYFIDILKVEQVAKGKVPFSVVMCVHAQSEQRGGSFVAIFIGSSGVLPEDPERLRQRIVRELVLGHVSSQRIEEAGMSALLSQFTKMFPVFFVDVAEIPKEPTASKPRLLLDLVDNGAAREEEIYSELLSNIPYFGG